MSLSTSQSVTRRFAVLLAAALFAVSCLALAGCSAPSSSGSSSTSASTAASSTASTDTITFTDDLGRSVTVPKKPQHVVAGMGSFADMWQLAGGSLAGAPDEAFNDYGINRSKVASIGGFMNINQESILALNPDFVILTGSASHQPGTADQTQLADALEQGGAAVAYFKVTTFDDYLRVLRTMCDITGRDDLYKKNGTQVQKRVNDAIKKYGADTKGKKTMIGISYSQGLRVQRADSMTGKMLADLGGVNIADDNPSLLQDFSTEALLDINPDYIFIVPMGTDEVAAKSAYKSLTDNKSWKSLKAAKNGHCYLLDSKLFLNKPNSHWDKAYTELGKHFAESK